MDGLIAYILSKQYADDVGEAVKQQGFKVQVEQDRSLLQTTGQEKIYYFLPKENAKPRDGYDEYIWTDAGGWEQTGVTDVDLSAYALKSSVYTKDEIDGIPLIFESGFIRITSGVINIAQREPLSSMRSSVTSALQGDRVYINVRGGSAAKAWAFLDATQHVITSSDIVAVDAVITAPADTQYLIVNDQNTYKECYKITKRIPVVDANSDDNTFPTTKAVYDAIQTAIGGVENGSY